MHRAAWLILILLVAACGSVVLDPSTETATLSYSPLQVSILSPEPTATPGPAVYYVAGAYYACYLMRPDNDCNVGAYWDHGRDETSWTPKVAFELGFLGWCTKELMGEGVDCWEQLRIQRDRPDFGP